MKRLTLVLFISLVLSIPALAFDTLISATQDAANSSEFTVTEENPTTLAAHNLSGSEEIELQIEYSDGNYMDVYYSDDTQVVLTPTKNMISITARGVYKLVKPTTTNSVTVVRYSRHQN